MSKSSKAFLFSFIVVASATAQFRDLQITGDAKVKSGATLKADAGGALEATSIKTGSAAETAISGKQPHSSNLDTFSGIMLSSDLEALLATADYATARTALSLGSSNDVTHKSLTIVGSNGAGFLSLASQGGPVVPGASGELRLSFGSSFGGSLEMRFGTSLQSDIRVDPGKSFRASNTLTLTGADGSTLNIGAGGTLGSNAYTSTAFVPQTLTINSHALTGNLTLTASDVGAEPIQTPATQAEMEAGSVTATRSMTPQRIKQAIAYQAPPAPIQAETAAYATAIQTAGGSIDAQTLFAVDAFVSAGKRDGWWTKLVDCSPMLGSNLAAALVKLKAASGAGGSLSNHNFVSGDYTPIDGIGTGSNSNSSKYLDTGVVPSAQSLSATNISYGTCQLTEDTQSPGYGFMGDSPATGTSHISVAYDGINLINDAGTTLGHGAHPGVGVKMETWDATSVKIFWEAISAREQTSSAGTTTLTSNVHLFHETWNGADWWQRGKLGFYFIGTSLTSADCNSLGNAIYQLQVATGRMNPIGGRTLFLGDSITSGQGATSGDKRWSAVVSRTIGSREYNAGSASSALLGTTTNYTTGVDRYLSLLAIPANNFVVMYTTNDQLGDAVTNGSSTIIGNCTTALGNIIAAAKAKRLRSVLVSAPYNGYANSTKQVAYLVGEAAAAAAQSVPFVDTYNLFVDTGSPATYFFDSPALHPNDAGHALISAHVVAALQGRIYRDLSLDFPSVSAGSTQALTVTMYGARAGMTTQLGVPLAQGLQISAAVTSNDTVTVTAYNPTGSSIDPTAFTQRVTVVIDQ
jgi:lysophospholipase L1-like esterase